MGWLPNFDSKGWNVRQQTTFSGIRLGDAPTRDDGKSPNGVVGFHAHKKAEQKVPKGWTNLDNYRASGWHGTCGELFYFYFSFYNFYLLYYAD